MPPTMRGCGVTPRDPLDGNQTTTVARAAGLVDLNKEPRRDDQTDRSLTGVAEHSNVMTRPPHGPSRTARNDSSLGGRCRIRTCVGIRRRIYRTSMQMP